ncbi:MAG: hypothetical protein KF851_02365 [Pirellulaceae bacterium]|nr:hypothetical protein [Pirellulaceae bacterium]
MRSIRNFRSLLVGALLTIGFVLFLVLNHGYSILVTFGLLLIGLPVALLFLMFNNPKHSEDLDWGMVLATPFCTALWPLFVFVLILSRPWKDKAWVERVID